MKLLRGAIKNLRAQIKYLYNAVGGDSTWSDGKDVTFYVASIRGEAFPQNNGVNMLYPGMNQETGKLRAVLVAISESRKDPAAVRICAFSNMKLNSLIARFAEHSQTDAF
jgi:hypothetical protein